MLPGSGVGLVSASVACDDEECDSSGEEQRAGVPHTHQTSVDLGVFPIVTEGESQRCQATRSFLDGLRTSTLTRSSLPWSG